MHTMPSWNLDATSILPRRELAAVLNDLKVRRSMNARRNLVVLRLSCCCGLLDGRQWHEFPPMFVREDAINMA
jgi:hypothetical protein